MQRNQIVANFDMMKIGLFLFFVAVLCMLTKHTVLWPAFIALFVWMLNGTGGVHFFFIAINSGLSIYFLSLSCILS